MAILHPYHPIFKKEIFFITYHIMINTCHRFPADMGHLKSREISDQREASALRDEVLYIFVPNIFYLL